MALSLAALSFIALCALPLFYMLGLSIVGEDGALSLRNYSRLLAEARQRDLFLNTLLLATATSLLATAIGAPLGLLLARADIPAKKFLRLALTSPLIVPPYVMGLAWIYLGGSSGIVARLTGSDLLSPLTYSLTGTVTVLAVCFYPLSMLATEAAARRVDGSVEEAALLVASPRRVLWRITLPIVAPSVVAAALIIFILALAEFGVPGLLRVPVFTTEVFTAFSALYDFGAATALAVPLLALALAAAVTARFMIGERLLVGRRGARLRSPLSISRHRAVAMAAIALAVFVALPMVALAAEVGRIDRVILALRSSVEVITNSLLLASLGASIAAVIGLLLGYARARMRRLASLIDLSMVVAFAAPGTVIGVGLIGLWNRPGLMEEIYRSRLIILIAYLARLIPVSSLILAAIARQVPASFEEAAEVAGAKWAQTFARIILPHLRAGIIAAWVVSFIFAFGELGATALVAPPGQATLPVHIYTRIANAPSGEVAALAVMQSAVAMTMLALFAVFVGREKRLL
jgi:iron(III) transport system permease protein